ncbi:carboxylesterase family protein [Staphylococcus coagulans]|uniref:carboxylesterase family protein n=1 Tax=Staphylococcus coagulans TaxID=74706 RepID=UPI00067A2D35|nr:carboxylesterase family protein [Staphylococcus coagulans]AKS67952.1 carboxylesterase [Staphylococcus schleiferi]MBA8774633.1 carboxylesterase family protein [Staphylococcus coagulans]
MCIDTKLGTIYGKSYAGFDVFKGIPYAQPPKGALRFKHAQPVTHYENDLYATEFGHTPIQPFNSLEAFFSPFQEAPQQSEDCLTLNIWRPHSKRDQLLPVIIFIYGGSFVNGHSAQDIYQPQAIVQQEDIIVVTFNYRLGALGFLDWSAIHSDWQANNGLSDQICALKWVYAHISSFGGDPQRLTLMGQSAGAMSIEALLRIRSVRPLIRHAVLLSGILQLDTPYAAQQKAQMFNTLKHRHFPNQTWETLDSDAILTLMDAHQSHYGPSKGLELIYQPVASKEIEPHYDHVDIPVLLGITSSEGDIYIKNEQKKLDPLQFQAILSRAGLPIPDLHEMITAQQQRRLITDFYFRQPFLNLFHTLSKTAPTWKAEFGWFRPNHPRYASAYHILDLIFWMGRLDILEANGLTLTSHEKQLSHRMIHDLCHFAKYGELRQHQYYM